MSRLTELLMPSGGTSDRNHSMPISVARSVVIIGANGSGKTRLGAWFELISPQYSIVHRVGAQKSLSIPNSISPIALADAELGFSFGMQAEQVVNYRRNLEFYSAPSDIERHLINSKKETKWGQQPETGLVNDFQQLLTYLISEQYEVSLAYFNQAKHSDNYATPPETKLDIIKRIWESVLPHRQLLLKASSIAVKPVNAPDEAAYLAGQMSDGERVAFYLIGQCLAATKDSIIVVDEPEIHLHRVIQSRLWDAIEQARPDCLLIYLTHDLEFASRRNDVTKIWIRSYDGQGWHWQILPETEGMPEEVLFAVLGSRKPVLFTEGEAGGYEQAIFSRIYPNWTIMPCGNCEQVIDATHSFTNLRHLHGNECRGIIDRDYRDEHNVARLQAQGVLVLETQEIENLMLDEAVLTAVLDHAIGTGALAGTVDEKMTAIKTHLFGQLARDREMLTTKRASWEVEKGLRRFGTAEGALGLAALQQAITATCELPVADIYQRIDQEFTRIIAAQDYPALLRLYNNKGLAKRIGQFFNLRESFPDYFRRLLSLPSNAGLVQALQAACPTLPAIAVA